MDEGAMRNLHPRRLAQLLGITFDSENADEVDNDEAASELLRSCLDGTWQGGAYGQGNGWMWAMRQFVERLGPRSERLRLGDVLTDRKSDLATIKDIRRRAKREVGGAAREVERSVAVTVYFAAIANALVYHGAKITTYSYESLEQSFTKLLEKRWMAPALARLFREAVKICQNMR
jgi:hypothetical protein